MSRRTSVLALLMIVALVTIGVAAQCSESQPQYYQAASRADIDYANSPYARVLPDMDRYLAQVEWFQTHLNADGSLKRPTEITMADLDVLDIILGTNDMNGIWHQIRLDGPITNYLTLSKIKTFSMTSTSKNIKPAWCISEGEAVMIGMLFNLKAGTYDGTWAYAE